MLLGLNNAFENPARQSFVLEMVGPEDLRNAVSLNSVLVNVARAVGPAVAGPDHRGRRRGHLLPAQRGELRRGGVRRWSRLDTAALQPGAAERRAAKGQLREGLRYVRRSPRARRFRC